MNRKRIAVTGLGLLTPVGNDVMSSWSAIRAGKSGINPIDTFDVSEFSTRFGGALLAFDRDKYLPAKEARRMDEFMHYGIAAGIQALEDSRLQEDGFEAERFGVAVGSGIGAVTTIEDTALQIRNSGPRKVTPFFVPGSIINMISGTLSIRFGLKGPNIAIVTACTTGTHNIGLAANTVSYTHLTLPTKA